VTVVIMPDELQVDKAFLERLFGKYGDIDKNDYDLDRSTRKLIEFLTKNHIDYIDLKPAFRKRYWEGITLYKLRDTHWNIAGNRLAAKELFKVFKKRWGLKKRQGL